MKRATYKRLMDWKSDRHRKPLILKGARQVGKTYLLQSFGSEQYPDVAYFNFEENPQLSEFFRSNIDTEKIIEKLSIFREKKIEPETTLIIFDEVQESGEALNSLKYFCEKAPQYHIAAAGSLLGVKLANQSPFPVGKVQILDLYPFSFYEFLEAVGKNQLREMIETKQDFAKLDPVFHEELSYQLRLYMFIGGMPEVVASYVELKDLARVRNLQQQILRSYGLDFAKYAERTEAIRISQIWDSLAGQLAKENKKFKYSEIKKGGRAAEFEVPLRWLKESGLILFAFNVSTIQLPLKAYRDHSKFKIYVFDTGLLGAMLNISIKSVVEKEKLFAQFNGAFTENYVAQQLVAMGSEDLFYWSIPQRAEVDFIVQQYESLIPIEVKSGLSKPRESMQLFKKKFNPDLVCLTSSSNFSSGGKTCNLPLYAILSLASLLRLAEPH